MKIAWGILFTGMTSVVIATSKEAPTAIPVGGLSSGELISLVGLGISIIVLLVRFAYKQGQADEKISSIETTVTDTSHKVDGLGRKLTSIISYLGTRDSKAMAVINSGSPMELTDLGQDLLNASGGKEFVESHLDGLLQLIEKDSPKTGLDVENAAKGIIVDVSDNSDFRQIKNFIYNNPSYKDIDVSLATLATVIGIFLRDFYLEKHPEVTDSGEE